MTPAAQLANYVASKFVKTAAPDLMALCQGMCCKAAALV
jgi:hypothetical protein